MRPYDIHILAVKYVVSFIDQINDKQLLPCSDFDDDRHIIVLYTRLGIFAIVPRTDIFLYVNRADFLALV